MKQELIKDLKRSYGIALVTAKTLGKAEQVDLSAGWTARMVSVTTHPVDEPETENHLITIRIRKNKDNYTLELFIRSMEGTRDFDDIDEAIETAAEILESLTEKFAEQFDEVMEWNWLGD